MKELVSAAIATLVLGSPQTSTVREITDPGAYSVYRTVIGEDWTVRVAKAKRLVIARETVTYDRCLPSGGPMATDWRPVLENYAVENASGRHLLPDQDLGLSYVLLPVQEIQQFFKALGFERGWPRFYERYPDSGGYMQLSAVGFDASKTRALVYTSHHCGGLCGGGQHQLLEKRDGRWRRAELKDVKMCAWAS